MDRQERKDMLNDAQQDLYDAIEKIRTATKGLPNEGYVDTYLVAQLQVHADEGHGGYISQDLSIEGVIQTLDTCEACQEETGSERTLNGHKVFYCDDCFEDAQDDECPRCYNPLRDCECDPEAEFAG